MMNHRPDFRKSERGNVFTVLLAAVGLAGVLGVSTYNLMTGPYASMARISGINATKNDMVAASKIIAMSALTNSTNGDCDADGAVEPPQWRAGTTGNVPVGGGFVPNNIGIPVITDAWGTDFGYCAWDTGTLNAAGCGGAGGLYLDGTPDSSTGNTVSQTVMAVISAGPDRKFQSTCTAYTNGTTAVVTQSGDDVVMPLSYAEASNTTSALWKTKSGDNTTIQIEKNIEIGSGASISTSGMGSFLAVNSTGMITSADQTQIGQAASATCNAGNTGLVKYVPGGGASYATPAIVKSTTGANDSSFAFSSLNDSFSSLPAAGSTIVVMVAGAGDGSTAFPAGTATVTDNKSNTYTLVKASPAGNLWNQTIAFYATYGIPAPTGTFTVMVNVGSTNYSWATRSFEITNLAAAAADATGAPAQVTSGTTITATTSGATTQTVELALAAVSSGAGFTSLTSNSGWSTYVTGITTSLDYNLVYNSLSATGSVSHQWTNGASTDLGAVIATFKAASSGSSDASLSVCDGADWVAVGGSGGGGSDGLWTGNGTTNIYPTTSTQSVSIGSSTLLKSTGAGTVMSLASNTGKDALVSMNTDCGVSCFPTLGTYRARGTTGSLTSVSSGDLVGRINFNGYLNGFKTLARIDATTTAAAGATATPTRVDFYTSTNAGVLTNTMRIDSTGNVGLGTLAPSEVIHVQGAPAQTAIDTYTTTANEGAVYSGLRSRASGAAVATADVIHNIDFTGYDTNSYETVARIGSVVNGTVSTNSLPQDIVVYTGASTSGLAERMRVSSAGYIGFGGITPAVRLDINGIFENYWDGLVKTYAKRAITGAGKRMIFDAYNSLFFCCEVTSSNPTYMNAGGTEYVANSVLLGTDLKSDGSYGNLLIGHTQTALASSAVDAVMIGEGNTAAGGGPVVGYFNSSSALGVGKVTIGTSLTNSSTRKQCIGSNLTCGSANQGFALGSYAVAQTGANASVIGLGSSAPASFTNTTANYLQIGNSSALWGIGTVTPAKTIEVTGTAGNSLSANWTNVSDRRLKDITGGYEKGLAEIRRLEPVMFHYKKNNPIGLPSDVQQIGFIAQDVRKAFPEAVATRRDGYLDLDVHSINVAMVSALTELDAKNKNIAEKNSEWKKRNSELTLALEKLESEMAALKKLPSTGATRNKPGLGWFIPVFAILAAGGIALKRRKGDPS